MRVFWNCCKLRFYPLKNPLKILLLVFFRLTESSKAPEFSAPAEAAKMTVNQQHLKQAWDISQVATKDDWLEWMHRLSVEFMKESPSHALRACMTLVDIHPPLAKELFNAAFLSCWSELYDQYQV
jgi:FKBP12-rapamycin complex-associated protein